MFQAQLYGVTSLLAFTVYMDFIFSEIVGKALPSLLKSGEGISAPLHPWLERCKLQVVAVVWISRHTVALTRYNLQPSNCCTEIAH